MLFGTSPNQHPSANYASSLAWLTFTDAHCATIMLPLNKLLTHPQEQSTSLVWTEEALTAFTAVKTALAEATLLTHPKPGALTSIMTDASDVAVGAVLQQHVQGHWHPLAYSSSLPRPGIVRLIENF